MARTWLDAYYFRGILLSDTAPTNGQVYIYNSSTMEREPNTPAGWGTVTTLSVVTANWFAWTVANATTTPAITLTTTATGMLKGNGTAISWVTATQNEISYRSDANTIGSLTTATYPSLTELSYVKGVTSAIQTQFWTKVTWPASATDDAIVRFDSTTGKLVKNSIVTISDTWHTTFLNSTWTGKSRMQSYDPWTGGVNFDMNLYNETAEQSCLYRLFRGTNTSGEVSMRILKGNNSTTINAQIAGNGNTYFAADNGNVVIWSSSVAASAKLAVTSTTTGFLPPRMTTTQRDAISSPAAWLMIYNTSTNKLNVYTTTWEAITSA